MAKIQIKDLQGDRKIGYEEMRKIHGGIRIIIDTDALDSKIMQLIRQGKSALQSYSSQSSRSSSSGGGGGSKTTPTTMESMDGS